MDEDIDISGKEGWIVLVLVLVIIVVVVLFFFFRQRVQLIEPEKCGNVVSDYGLVAGFDKPALTSCGPMNNEACIFDMITTLKDAVIKCNEMDSICTEFSYDPAARVMRFTNPTVEKVSSNTSNLYILQR